MKVTLDSLAREDHSTQPRLKHAVPYNWPPRVWLVMSYRAGENAQILALAEALKWPYEVKRLVYRRYGLLTDILCGTNLTGIVKSRSSPLTPPWPDLVISGGMRNEPVCRWIQKQAGEKNVRLVHIGRPWARLEHFDLVITTPQYRLPTHPNVLHNRTTLHRVSAHQLAKEAAVWLPRLAHLPQPYIAVVIGGHSGPYTFGRKAARRLGNQASAMANNAGGSLLITTSARTPHSTVDPLAAAITCPMYLFQWTPRALENPYFGFLALADSIVVTSDSIAMLTEACATRKPVYIFDLGEGVKAMRASALARGRQPMQRQWGSRTSDFRLSAFLYRQMMKIGPARLTRDLSWVHDYLVSSGRAVWLGERFPGGPPPPLLEDIPQAVERVQALFRWPRG